LSATLKAQLIKKRPPDSPRHHSNSAGFITQQQDRSENCSVVMMAGDSLLIFSPVAL